MWSSKVDTLWVESEWSSGGCTAPQLRPQAVRVLLWRDDFIGLPRPLALRKHNVCCMHAAPHGRGRAVAIRSLQCISDSVNTSAHPEGEARGKTLETAKRAKRARGRMTHQPRTTP